MQRYRLLSICFIALVLSLSWSALAQESSPTETPAASTLPTQEATPPLLTEEPVVPTPTETQATVEPTLLPTDEASPTPTDTPATPLATDEASPTPTPIVISPTPDPLAVVFSTDFETANPAFPLAEGWTSIALPEGTAIQSGVGLTRSAYTTQYLDAAIRVRVLFGSGTVRLSVREMTTDTLTNRYSVTLTNDGTLKLWRSDVTVATALLTLTEGAWTTLELRAVGALVTVRLNDIEALTYTDAAPLPIGEISLAAEPDSVLRLDDLAVLAVGEGVPVVTITPEPTDEVIVLPTLAPTTEPTTEVTAEPTAESTVLATEESPIATEEAPALPQSSLPGAGPVGTGPTITTPTNASFTNDSTPPVNWAQVPAATKYVLQVATNSTFTTGLQSFDVTNAQLPYSLPTLADGIYYVRVQTYTSAVNFTNFGPIVRFTVDTVAPSKAVTPLTPALYSRVTTLRPTFTWTLLSDATGYQVQVDADGTFPGGTGSLHNSAILTTATYTIPTTSTALPQGTAYFRVVARDNAGNLTIPSSSIRFTTALALTPAANTTQPKARPAFAWAAVAGTGITYTLQVSTDINFSSFVVNTSGLTTTTATPSVDLAAAPGGVRYWRVLVNGVVPNGTESANKIIINLAPLPAAPILTAPAALISDSTPTITWNAVANAASYEIQVSDSKTFVTIPIFEGTSATPTITLSTPLADGTYYARVRGLNGAQAAGAYSVARMFIVETTAPDAPTLKGPLNTVLITPRPTFTWGAAPAAQAVVSYRLDVSSDNFTTTLSGYTDRSVTGVTFTAPTTVAALSSGLYQWRLRAVDKSGNTSANSATGTFYINTTAIKVPVIATVEGAASGTPLTNDTQPEITLTNSNPTTLGGQTLSHEVQLSTTNTFTSPITIAIADLSVDDADWAAPLANAVSQIYYIRARPVYGTGSTALYGPYSAARTLTLDTTAPAAPILTGPVNGAVVTTTRPTFSWAVSTGASTYRLDVSSDNFTTTLASYSNRTVSGTTFTGTASGATTVTALANGLYQWRVRAVDALSQTSVNSTTGVFYVNTALLKVPVITLVEGATSGSPVSNDTRPEVTLTTTNPASLSGLTQAHEVQFSTTAAFTSPITIALSDLSVDDADWSSPLASAAAQLYYIRARTIYTNGSATLYGPYSAARTFTLDTVAPVTPAVTAPTGTITTVRPTITWAASATTKTYYIYDVVSGSPVLLGSSATTSFVVPTALVQGPHIISVLAQDAAGNTSTEVIAKNKSFDIFIGTAPAAASTILSASATIPVKFTWAPVVGATSYKLQISTVKDDFSSPQEPALATATSTTATVTLARGASYYWRVLINNGALPDTVNRTFAIVTSALPAATLNAVETDNIINLVDDSDGITFTWAAPTGAPVSVAGYRVQTSTANTFPPASTITSADLGTVTTYTAPSGSLPETTKYWRVVTQYSGTGGAVINSVGKAITIDRTAPPAPTITAPIANSIGSSVKPTLTWVAASTATSYRLDISTDSGFSTFVTQYADRSVTGVSLILPVNVPQGWLYARLQSVDAAGNVGVESGVRRFGVFIGTSPAESAVTSGTTPTFVWTAVPGAASYTIQVDADGDFSSATYSFTDTASPFTVPNAQALAQGAYGWRVIVTGDSTSTLLARTLIIGPALTAPVLLSPASGAITTGN